MDAAEPHISYRLCYVRCGKANCGVCSGGKGHGPYWYAHWRSGQRAYTRYIGKQLTPADQPGAAAAGHSVTAAPGGPDAAGGGTHFRVYTLGQFAVRCGAGNDTMRLLRWPRSSAASLFTLLLLKGRLSRQQIAEELFEDAATRSAPAVLNSAVHTLRRVLEPERLRGTPSRYLLQEGHFLALTLGAGAWVDFQAFEALVGALRQDGISRSDVELAATLYRGDLLPEESGSWCHAPRERLHLAWQGVLLRLAALQFSDRAYEPSLVTLHQLLADDPLLEEAVCALMRSFTALHRRADALRAYVNFAHALRDDIGAAPATETQRLAADIRRGVLLP